MYDAIIVGARCAGSPTAMLLARKGYRVLLVDKGSFPSDTISTHIIWPHGAAIMDRWGLLDRLAATGCPPIALNMIFDVGPFALKGAVTNTNGGRGGFCPRRIVLDKLLVDAAVASGAELRETFAVESLIWDGDRVAGIKGRSRSGGSVEERSTIVIGADGVHSFVVNAVRAEEYDTRPPLATYYYTYYSGFDADDIEQYVRPYQGAACFPTNDGLTLIAGVWPSSRFHEVRADVEGNVRKLHVLTPTVADRLRDARREEKWVGTAGVPNYFRKPYGPGWALVGDAGYDKDPLTAQGISDSFIDAENLTEALDAGFSGRRALDAALAEYQSRRDRRAKPMYEFTCELAKLEPPPPPMQQLFAALHGNREATNEFYAALTGSLPVPAFMNPENINRIVAGTAASSR
ncbi:MAG TPA: NAD(P)/FAD-dependent oxidoreductase [Vicinamibacterales bacterium]|jgi:2-polyprenyl-6-methoxyphenol hydroxylase-like FAD-dependent oxidoreductase|nr:NAD(P)/FAD-dependent oxidoreductase [Vicinamibacterales bacterium]